MSAPIQASSRLLNSRLVKGKPSNPDLLTTGYMTGAIATKPASGLANTPLIRRHSADPALVASFMQTGTDGRPKRYPDGFGPFGARARQKRGYDRAKSRQRKRMMGGDGRLPNTMRGHFTEGERAVLSVISDQMKRKGRCDLFIEKIAALAGVSVRLVQYAIAKASGQLGSMLSLPKNERPPLLLAVEYRKRRGRPYLSNVIKIISREWLNWLSYQPSEAPAAEAEEAGAWTVLDIYAGRMTGILSRFSGQGCRKVHRTKIPISLDVEEDGKPEDLADGWQRLRHGLTLQEGNEEGPKRE